MKKVQLSERVRWLFRTDRLFEGAEEYQESEGSEWKRTWSLAQGELPPAFHALRFKKGINWSSKYGFNHPITMLGEIIPAGIPTEKEIDDADR